MAETMCDMHIRLPEALYAQLRQFAIDRNYSTPSEAAREALRQFMHREPTK